MTINEWKNQMIEAVENFKYPTDTNELKRLIEIAEILTGAKVKIRSDLNVGEVYGGLEWNSFMGHELGGKTVYISYVSKDDDGNCNGYEVYAPGTNKWFVSLEMIEQV